jgi:hypothetical protein
MCNKTYERKSETKWKFNKFEVQISKFLNSILFPLKVNHTLSHEIYCTKDLIIDWFVLNTSREGEHLKIPEF